MKVRLICTGWNMVYGSQYTETFAPVASISTIRIFLSWGCAVGEYAASMDISGAYLKSDMDSFEIYMKPPKGCEEEMGSNGKPKVWLLRKFLYGLKSSGWAWHRNLYLFLISLGFVACTLDPCILIKRCKEGWIVVITYVVRKCNQSVIDMPDYQPGGG